MRETPSGSSPAHRDREPADADRALALALASAGRQRAARARDATNRRRQQRQQRRNDPHRRLAVRRRARRRSRRRLFRRLRSLAWRGAAAAGIVALLAWAWLVPLIGSPSLPGVRLPGLILVASIAGALILHEILRWRLPLKRLHRTLDEVRTGQAPMDELLRTSGPLSGLAESILDILRQMRQQKAHVSQLEREVRHRIASRTDALERLVASLRHQASTDTLTRLQNRRALDQYLPQAVAQCLKEHCDLCLLMIDVDHFKLLNDTLGHAAGDNLLHTFACLIRSSIRQQDAAFRYGGDEFVVALPRLDRKQGQALAKRLIVLSHELGKMLHLPRTPRLSVGLAVLSALPAPTAEALLTQADTALYAVKRSRRNPTPPPQPLAERPPVATMLRSL